MVAGLESKLENGAASLVQRFNNTKRTGSPTTTSPNNSIRKKVQFSSKAIAMNETSTSDAKSMQTSNRYSNSQRETNNGTSKFNSMISPTIINRIPGRKPPQISTQDVSTHAGDTTAEKKVARQDQQQSASAIPIVERISPKINSTARSLISMFESKKSNSAPITPQNEYWQYTGKLKNNSR